MRHIPTRRVTWARSLLTRDTTGFHGQVKAGHHPNAKKLCEKFEISQKQAQREIEFMRDRLCAALFYNPALKGYEYEDDSYELPPIWFKEDELLALCLALRLASTLPDHKLKGSLYELLEKFLTFRFLDSPPSLTGTNRIMERLIGSRNGLMILLTNDNMEARDGIRRKGSTLK